MPAADLSAPDASLRLGFFGKLPTAGDFVSRGLPRAFTDPWDRWLAMHLVPRLKPAAPPIRFCRTGACPASGVIVASADRAGRPFPLTLAALAPLSPAAARWYAALTSLARAGARGALSPDALAAALAALPPLEGDPLSRKGPPQPPFPGRGTGIAPRGWGGTPHDFPGISAHCMYLTRGNATPPPDRREEFRVWTESARPRAVEPEDPGRALDSLLGGDGTAP